MNNFKEGGFKKQGGKFGGRPSFGGNRSGGNAQSKGKFGGHARNDRPSEMFKATCSDCQKSCEVPFRPSSDKPVYCSNCFGKKNDDSRNDRGGHDRNERSGFSKPARDERSARNDRPQVQPDAAMIDIKRQLATIESRLNRILDLINPAMPAVKATPQVEVKEEVKEVAKIEKKKEVAKPVVKKTVKKVEKKVAVKKPAKKAIAKKAVKKVTKKTAK